MSELTADFPAARVAEPQAMAMFLSQARPGRKGAILAVAQHVGRQDPEMERRLLEMGFVEGAVVEVLHEGPFGRDPMVVRLDDMRVALRRAEADLALFLMRSRANVRVSSSVSSSSSISSPFTIAAVGPIRSWQTREHRSAARSRASRATAVAMGDCLRWAGRADGRNR